MYAVCMVADFLVYFLRLRVFVCVVCDGCGVIGHIKSQCPAVLSLNTQGLVCCVCSHNSSSFDVCEAQKLATILLLCQSYILGAARLTVLMIQLIIIKIITVNNILILNFD